jgi:mycofactocin precursor
MPDSPLEIVDVEELDAELDTLVEEDLLVEEVSIDGMCGVY